MKIDVSSVPLSPARRAGDFLYLSGQVAMDADGAITAPDIEGQTRRVLDNIGGVLRAHGADFADVVSASVFLADAADFPAYNKAYGSYFAKPAPARTTVIAGLLLGAKIEITVTAYLGAGPK